MDLQTPITSAGRKYSIFIRKLEKLGIRKLEDLLFHVPFRYENYEIISSIERAQSGETVTIQGTVNSIKNQYTRGRLTLQKATVTDNTGVITAVWFNQPFITRVIQAGLHVSLAGRVEMSGLTKTMQVRDYEVLETLNDQTIHTGRLVPVYPETKGLTSKFIRNRVKELLDTLDMQEYLPEETLKRHNLVGIKEALQAIHFPETLVDAKVARHRLSFDELFTTQLSAAVRRHFWEMEKVASNFKVLPYQNNIEAFWGKLPFQLTGAQKKAVREIFSDLSKNRAMNRLLQGDVGSGKTVVATACLYLAYLNGFQSVFMAPTEILAKQHFETVKNLLEPFGVKVGLVTGNKKIGIKKQESRIKERKNHNSSLIIHNSESFDILIGTHALLNQAVKFEKLGLVIIDEQQRFGVAQRGVLRDKGNNPHFLTMTATPIPRTVFLAAYGDLDLSYLNEMPVGRQIVKTWLVPEKKRSRAYEWIKKQVISPDANGGKNQIFIICPFIEESESMTTVKAAVKEFERLKTKVFPDLKLGLLHGKLKGKEKEQTLKEFAEQKIDILVATPVVEVGIDIPSATVIVVEASERFGLSQLHQLRGRVGRSDKRSYCLLFTESKSPETRKRLVSLETTYNGAELAEIDLRLRGPGDMYGTMQHGISQLKVASFSDFELIEITKREADLFLPKIASYPKLIDRVNKRASSHVSPD